MNLELSKEEVRHLMKVLLLNEEDPFNVVSDGSDEETSIRKKLFELAYKADMSDWIEVCDWDETTEPWKRFNFEAEDVAKIREDRFEKQDEDFLSYLSSELAERDMLKRGIDIADIKGEQNPMVNRELCEALTLLNELTNIYEKDIKKVRIANIDYKSDEVNQAVADEFFAFESGNYEEIINERGRLKNNYPVNLEDEIG